MKYSRPPIPSSSSSPHGDPSRDVPQAKTVRDVLRLLEMGSSVAEFDQSLAAYFVETEVFDSLIADDSDTVAGHKGTGKTALYLMMQHRYPTLLPNVVVVAGFNPAGTPIFQQLVDGEPMSEHEYMVIWKTYFLSLAANWLLADNEGAFSNTMHELDRLLTKAGLRNIDPSASTIFGQVLDLARRVSSLKSAEVSATITPEGLPVVTPRLVLSETPVNEPMSRHDDALRLLDAALEEVQQSVWIALDRLDESFQGFPSAERPVLRALLRSYLDFSEFKRLRLKLFVRKDLFRRIVEGGFVNLTHVNARKVELVWNDEDLFHLLCRRLRQNGSFVEAIGASHDSRDNEALFYKVFPRHVGSGPRAPTTWNWMLSHIRDGNGIASPRNLIDLVKAAQDGQRRAEHRFSTPYDVDSPDGLIQSAAIKQGLATLSAQRLEDTLLAEAGSDAPLIERFRCGRAEHNDASLAQLLDVAVDDVRAKVRPLVELGFLRSGETYKIPMLYRSGLQIRQGKAYAAEPTPSDSSA